MSPLLIMACEVLLLDVRPTKDECDSESNWTSFSHKKFINSLIDQGVLPTNIATGYFCNFPIENDFRNEVSKTHHEDFVQWDINKKAYGSPFFLELVYSLKKLILENNPKIIIPTDKWSLYILTLVSELNEVMNTDKTIKLLGGINKYRSSVLPLSPFFEHTALVIPSYPPNYEYKEPNKSLIIKWDIAKIGRIYKNVTSKSLEDKVIGGLKVKVPVTITPNRPIEWYLTDTKNYIIGESIEIIASYYDKIREKLEQGPTFISVDIETKFKTFIECIGVTISTEEGLCIPLYTTENPTPWSEEAESLILFELFQLLAHPNAKKVGQNFAYDSQFILESFLVRLFPELDTMLVAHTLFNTMPKDLAILNSIVNDKYVYWKDDGKTWAEK